MPRNRKLFVHGKAHFVTTRILEGLPLVPTCYMNIILESILARAKQLYDISTADFLFMSNHLHLIEVIGDPAHADDFIRYIKTESAHAINKLMGRRKGPVWEERYDSPVILDIEKLKETIIYIYTNPQKANLVDKIDDYPGLSSWKALKTGVRKFKTYRMSRVLYRKLAKNMSLQQRKAYANELKENSLGRSSYTIDLEAAFNAFDSDESFDEFREEIIDRVRDKESELREQRVKKKRGILGAKALSSQSIYKRHIPKKFGKRMICLGSTKEIRKSFIETFKELCAQCTEAYCRIINGCKKTLFPPGFFMPGGLRHSEALPCYIY